MNEGVDQPVAAGVEVSDKQLVMEQSYPSPQSTPSTPPPLTVVSATALPTPSAPEEEPERALGKRLQMARQAAGLTQQTLCQKASLSYSTLAKIERGAIKAPSIFTIKSIASALNMSLDTLLDHQADLAVTPAAPQRTLLKTKSGVSFIYFDINGCLVRFFQGAFTKLAQDTDMTADTIESAYWHLNDEVCRGKLTLDEFNTAFSERLKLSEPIDWQSYYLDAIEPITAMHELLQWARERYRVGLLSNIMPGLITALQQKGYIPTLPYDAVIDSSVVGAIKPEAKIFEIATERAGCPPGEILLIDDTRANLMAAEKADWHVLWFDGYRTDESVARIKQALEPQI